MAADHPPSARRHGAGLAFAGVLVLVLIGLWRFALPLLDDTAVSDLRYIIAAAVGALVVSVGEKLWSLFHVDPPADG